MWAVLGRCPLRHDGSGQRATWHTRGTSQRNSTKLGALTCRSSSNTDSSTPLSSKSTRELLMTSSMMAW